MGDLPTQPAFESRVYWQIGILTANQMSFVATDV